MSPAIVYHDRHNLREINSLTRAETRRIQIVLVDHSIVRVCHRIFSTVLQVQVKSVDLEIIHEILSIDRVFHFQLVEHFYLV